jgi:acetyltransferase
MYTTMPHASSCCDGAEQPRAVPGNGEVRRTLRRRERPNDEQLHAGRSTPRKPYIIRRVTVADTEQLVELLTKLSEQARQLRYMAPRPLFGELAWAEAARMACRQTHNHLTLIALFQDAEPQQVIAVAELIRDEHSPRLPELAVVVRDDHQGQGLGRALVERLVEHARSCGIDSIRADLLAENHAMLGLLRGLGLPLRSTTRYGEIEVIVSILTRPKDQTGSTQADATRPNDVSQFSKQQ